MLIHQACTTGREEECIKSKYAQGGRLVGSLGGAYAGGLLGAPLGYGACNLVFGLPSGGTSLFWCGLVGAAAGGYYGGTYLSDFGKNKGALLYEALY